MHLKLVCASMLIISLLLCFTHEERRLETDLIEEGVVLAVLSEYIFLVINRI